MDRFSVKEKQLFDLLNRSRLNLKKEFDSSNQPKTQVFFNQLCKCYMALSEQKSINLQQDKLAKEVFSNFLKIVASQNFFNDQQQEQSEPEIEKFDIQWSRPKKKELKKQQPKPVEKNFQIDKNRFKKRNQGPKEKQKGQFQPFRSANEVYQKNRPDVGRTKEPQERKAEQKADVAGLLTASVMQKGTSVRKKFVPPYKKPSVKEESQQRDQDGRIHDDTHYSGLEPKLIAIIESEILEKMQKTKWSQIAGLGFAKKIIHEVIVWPMLRPDIFVGLRAPPKAILLFGPPGTGKTMIGRAIASQASATFFSISASSLASKWVGQSQKLVKTLFSVARAKQPSVIFIDEIDSLLSSRQEGEQQSARKIKTEFLVELDGAKNSEERVLVIGATNRPQQLDDAIRRRFVKRLYIPLPNLQGRVQLIKSLIDQAGGFALTESEITELGKQTKGYSGADMYLLCSQAAMIPVRNMLQINDVRHSDIPEACLKECMQALTLVRPSVNDKALGDLEEWNRTFGSYQFTPDELQQQER